MEPTNQVMTIFMVNNDFNNIIKSNTRFKINWSMYWLNLTKYAKEFSEYRSDRNRCSDRHLLIFSFLKTSLTEMPSNE